MFTFTESESEVAQSCSTLCDPMDCGLPGSSVRGILQARVLEWVAISFSRVSSQPRDRTQVSHIPGRCFNLIVIISLRGRFSLLPENIRFKPIIFQVETMKVISIFAGSFSPFVNFCEVLRFSIRIPGHIRMLRTPYNF